MVKPIINNILSVAATASSEEKTKKWYWVTFLRVAVTLGIFAALFFWWPVDKLFAAIRTIPLYTWLFVLLLFLVGHFFSAMKWRLLLSAAGARTARVRAMQAHGAGLFATIFLPGIAGGDFVRAAMIARERKARLGAIVVGSLGDRFNDIMALVLISFFASLFLPEVEDSVYTNALTIITAAILSGVVGGTWLILRIPLNRLPEKLSRVLEKFTSAITSFLADPLSVALGLALSIVIQCTFVFLNIVLAEAMGLDVPVMLWFFAWPVTKLIAVMPISMGGLGVRNVVLAGLMAPFGIDAGLVVAQSLCWDGVVLFTGLAGLGVAAFPTRIPANMVMSGSPQNASNDNT